MKMFTHHFVKLITLIVLIVAPACTPKAAPAPEAGPMLPSAEKPLRLQLMALDRKSFSPASEETITIRFEPSMFCAVTVVICDSRGVPVRRLVDHKPCEPEIRTIAWDGRDESGEVVSSGVYFYVVDLAAEGKKYTYNPYHKTHGKTLKATTASYDREHKHISYTLPQAAQVMIRAGLKDGGPLLKTILDWTPKPAGTYRIAWDGKDESGSIELSSHPKMKTAIFAYSLADNSIIVDSPGSGSATRDGTAAPVFSPKLAPDRNQYAQTHLTLPHSPRITLEFPKKGYKDNEVAPVLLGSVPVTISIADEDRLVLENSRYEIMLFVDTVFLFEDEAGFSPFTYQWDTTHLPEGEHLLTVNLCSYNDQCGVVSKKVFIEKE